MFARGKKASAYLAQFILGSLRHFLRQQLSEDIRIKGDDLKLRPLIPFKNIYLCKVQ